MYFSRALALDMAMHSTTCLCVNGVNTYVPPTSAISDMCRAKTCNLRAILFLKRLIYSTRAFQWALLDKFDFLLYGRGSPTFGDRREGQNAKIAMKFGMLVIDLREKAVSIDELAHEKVFCDTPMEEE